MYPNLYSPIGLYAICLKNYIEAGQLWATCGLAFASAHTLRGLAAAAWHHDATPLYATVDTKFSMVYNHVDLWRLYAV